MRNEKGLLLYDLANSSLCFGRPSCKRSVPTVYYVAVLARKKHFIHYIQRFISENILFIILCSKGDTSS